MEPPAGDCGGEAHCCSGEHLGYISVAIAPKSYVVYLCGESRWSCVDNEMLT